MNNQIWLSSLHSVIHICLDNKFEQIRIPKCYNLPFNCYGEIILFSTKTTLRIERVSQNGECLKKIFRVHVSDMYLFKLSPGSFCLFMNFECLKMVMVCFLYLLVEKLCHKEAHFPSTTLLSHAGQVVFLYSSLQVGYFSILTCAFSSNFTYLLWMKSTSKHSRQLGHTHLVRSHECKPQKPSSWWLMVCKGCSKEKLEKILRLKTSSKLNRWWYPAQLRFYEQTTALWTFLCHNSAQSTWKLDNNNRKYTNSSAG